MGTTPLLKQFKCSSRIDIFRYPLEYGSPFFASIICGSIVFAKATGISLSLVYNKEIFAIISAPPPYFCRLKGSFFACCNHLKFEFLEYGKRLKLNLVYLGHP